MAKWWMQTLYLSTCLVVRSMEALFLSIGLDPATAKNATTNAKLSATLSAIITEAGVQGGCDKSIGNLLYQAATKV